MPPPRKQGNNRIIIYEENEFLMLISSLIYRDGVPLFKISTAGDCSRTESPGQARHELLDLNWLFFQLGVFVQVHDSAHVVVVHHDARLVLGNKAAGPP